MVVAVAAATETTAEFFNVTLLGKVVAYCKRACRGKQKAHQRFITRVGKCCAERE